MAMNEHTAAVQRMFGRIARRYDLLNRILSMGQDIRWRKEVVARLDLPRGARLLDDGCGTGDLVYTARKRFPGIGLFASDLTSEMVRIGKQRPGGDQVHWVIADAQHLPFANEVFDGLVSGYLLRNVADLPLTLAEQARVLTPGSSAVALDTTPPPNNLLRPLIDFYLLRIIPLIGKIVAGDAEAYAYLPSTTVKFLTAEVLAERFRQAGFERISFVRRMFGSMAIHQGYKPGKFERTV